MGIPTPRISIPHTWELDWPLGKGDTLVVDVVGLSERNLAFGEERARSDVQIYTGRKEHVVERWSRKGDTLTYEATWKIK